MNKAYLLTGGNMGNRQMMLQEAKNRIQKEIGTISASSEVYETAAWGKPDQPSFLNQALEVITTLSAREVLTGILSIEAKMGRFRQEKFGPRVIDIDILLYNDDIINEPGLVVPHAQLAGRRFALTPLAEMVPRYVHPILKETIGELLLRCKDELPVKKLEN